MEIPQINSFLKLTSFGFKSLDISDFNFSEPPKYHGFGLQDFEEFKMTLSKSRDAMLEYLSDMSIQQIGALGRSIISTLSKQIDDLDSQNQFCFKMFEAAKDILDVEGRLLLSNNSNYIAHFVIAQQKGIFEAIRLIEQILPEHERFELYPVKFKARKDQIVALFYQLKENNFLDFPSDKRLADFIESTFLYYNKSGDGSYKEIDKSLITMNVFKNSPQTTIDEKLKGFRDALKVG